MAKEDVATMVMLVGVSGSGKSTLAEQYQNEGYVVFSSDAIRKEIYGDETEQKNPKMIFDILHKRIMNALKEGKNCVYDATNLNAHRRKTFIEMLNNAGIGCNKVCHTIIKPYEICIKNNENRDRHVPDNIIQRQFTQFQVPTYDEGWNGIRQTICDQKLVKDHVTGEQEKVHIER